MIVFSRISDYFNLAVWFVIFWWITIITNVPVDNQIQIAISCLRSALRSTVTRSKHQSIKDSYFHMHSLAHNFNLANERTPNRWQPVSGDTQSSHRFSRVDSSTGVCGSLFPMCEISWLPLFWLLEVSLTFKLATQYYLYSYYDFFSDFILLN